MVALTGCAGPTGSPASTTGIAIDPKGPRTPEELGYTKAYADAKQFQSQKAMTALASARAAQVAAASGYTMALDFYMQYHQKADHQCLAATTQSILAWNFGTATYVGSSVASSQSVLAANIGTTSAGADDYRTFRYINTQFARWASTFRYVPVNDTSLAQFRDRVQLETDYWYQPLYVRVDVTNPNYVWHQASPALHATVSIGYYFDGTTIAGAVIGDPYTASTSGCPTRIGYPGYSSTPDYGCIYWAYPLNFYYNAKSGVVRGELPEQY